MSSASLFAVTAISLFLDVIPIETHKLITDPYPISEWNSIIVSSDPIKVTEKRENDEGNKFEKLRKITRARKRSFDDCPENDFGCLYGNEKVEGDDSEKSLEILSGSLPLNVVKETDENGGKSRKNFHHSGGKSYWSGGESHRDDFQDGGKNGWITLDPVPWSTSKVSKWRPNVEPHDGNRPWDYSFPAQRPVQQFWVSGSSYRPHKPVTSQWGLGNNDIITDNKPSDFPTGNVHHSPSFVHHSFYEYKEPFQKHDRNSGSLTERHQTRFPQKSHPSTYPGNGNGEWVLLSTKKGYSPPTKRWPKADSPPAEDRILRARNIRPVEITRYHEEVLNDKNLHSAYDDAHGDGETVTVSHGNHPAGTDSDGDEKVMVPLQVIRGGNTKEEESAKTMRRKVKLQVLPSSESPSFAHGGLLEVDPNRPTVNEAVKEDQVKSLQRKRFRKFKLVPANKVTGKGKGQKGAITLAAVGAGMIPATMAMLIPMAFGRSKRSFSEIDQKFIRNWKRP